MEKPEIITMTGNLGSGKTTVARRIERELGYAFYSTGSIQREIAATLGITSLELNRRAETDTSIDQLIDGGTAALVRDQTRLIIDSRLAWHFAPRSFKVFLYVHPVIGAGRIFNEKRGKVENYDSLEEAIAYTRDREASEQSRFLERYGVDLTDFKNFDLILDTSYARPDEIADVLLASYRSFLESSDFTSVWLSPKTPFPTEDARALDEACVQRMRDRLSGDPGDSPDPIPLLRADRLFYIYDGHDRASAHLLDDRPLMPAAIVASDAERTPDGMTATEYARTHCDADKIRGWEDAHGFNFPM
jgi:predicted cytidylate kinase